MVLTSPGRMLNRPDELEATMTSTRPDRTAIPTTMGRRAVPLSGGTAGRASSHRGDRRPTVRVAYRHRISPNDPIEWSAAKPTIWVSLG